MLVISCGRTLRGSKAMAYVLDPCRTIPAAVKDSGAYQSGRPLEIIRVVINDKLKEYLPHIIADCRWVTWSACELVKGSSGPLQSSLSHCRVCEWLLLS